MNDIKAWADKLTCKKRFDDIEILTISVSVTGEDMPNIHIRRGIEKIAKSLNRGLVRSDWIGNKTCNSNWDELHFVYNGYKFFQLVPKEF